MSDLPLPELRADCGACSALCCVVLPFDADQGFGFDKQANTPCSHLCADFSCGIHARLVEEGFTGCTRYDCHGAGQRTTRLFAEVNWRAAPERTDEIFRVFSTLQQLHGQQVLLALALARVTEGPLRERLLDRQQQLEGLCLLAERQEPVALDAVQTATRRLLQQLASEPAIIALRTFPTREP